MRKLKTLVLTSAFMLLLGSVVLIADSDAHTVTMTVDSIAVLSLTGGNVTLTVEAPAQGGQTPSSVSSNTNYLQYTSTVPSAQARALTVAWGASDAAPGGCSLKIQATPTGGSEGSTAGQVTITNSAQNVVTSVGSCATGTGGSDGAQLTYTLSVDDMSSLVAGESKQATVTYTLTDAS